MRPHSRRLAIGVLATGMVLATTSAAHAEPQSADGAGNSGYAAHTGSVRLYRNGQLVGESPYTVGTFEVPEDAGDYRAVVTATRQRDTYDVSTTVTAEWTFRSAYVEEETPVTAAGIRFSPKLDDTNSGQAGRALIVPVSLQRNGSGAAERPTSLTVDISYDEGVTWRKAATLLNVLAIVPHPGNATSVSLRATATDHAGNTVTQTIIRMYKLR